MPRHWIPTPSGVLFVLFGCSHAAIDDRAYLSFLRETSQKEACNRGSSSAPTDCARRAALDKLLLGPCDVVVILARHSNTVPKTTVTHPKEGTEDTILSHPNAFSSPLDITL